MPQRRIPLQIGNFYHIYNRGNNHQTLFFERDNYLYFLQLVRQLLTSNGVDVAAYSLMPNHYHFLVYLRDETLSNAMKSLSFSYTKAMNQRFNRVGVLFQGRFQSMHVDRSDYSKALNGSCS
jgi:REP element-mobilizing transposase RayT